MTTIKRKIGESMIFTGGAEESVQVEVIGFHAPGSMNHGDKTLRFNTAMQSCSYGVSISPSTLQSVMDWATGK